MLDRHGDRPDTPVTEPAPTITSNARSDVWAVDRRTRSKAAGGGMTDTVPVPMDRPAPTLTESAARHTDPPFHAEITVGLALAEHPLPARLAAGYRGRPEDYTADGDYTGQRSMDEAIKLTVAEALILQSFDAGYPIRGTRTKQFEQVGNAVPPLLAAHVLRDLSRADVSRATSPPKGDE